jgi:hypothetical protein
VSEAIQPPFRAVAVRQGEYPTVLTDDAGKERTVVQVVDAEAVAAILAAYAADPRPLLVDGDHRADKGGSTEAYAWASELRGEQGGISVLLEPTDIGAPAIATKRYRYPSPVFEQADLQWLDAAQTRARPLRLARLGLTNLPNMDLPALVNSAATRAGRAPQPTTPQEGTPSMDYKAKLLAALGLPAEATDEEIDARLAEVEAAKADADADAAVNAAGIPDEAKPDAKKACLAAPAATNAVLGALKAACNAVASRAAKPAPKQPQRVLLNSDGRQPRPGAADTARLRQAALNAHAAANPGLSRDAAYNAVRATHPELF